MTTARTAARKSRRRYWKDLFIVDDEDGEGRARAFILTQKDLLRALSPESLELREFRRHQVPLGSIQEKTGVRFVAAATDPPHIAGRKRTPSAE